jgi:glycosyltransferase involved in cell wall biosynthesis
VFPDTYPTVVLLAMAAGRPIIGSAIGGIPEQIDDGVTGLLVPPADPSALAKAIVALARDPGRREALGAAGKKKMAEEFAPAVQAQLLWKVYADIARRLPPDQKEGSRLGHAV